MKSRGAVKKQYGVDPDTGFDLLCVGKVSGTRISREVLHRYHGCSRCFPHGYDMLNSTYRNRQRSWKKYRKTQYK